jgi:superkiller protein 3
VRRAAAVALVVLAASCGGGDGAEAKRDLHRVKDLKIPTDAEREAAEKLHEAEVLLAADKPRLAEPLLRRVIELDPGDAQATEMLARVLIGRGKLDEAAPLLRRALANAPRSPGLRALHVQALMNLGDFAAAEVAAREWTDVDAQSADAWFDLGRALYRLERWEDAITAFRRAETLKAARADIRSELGLALAAAGHLGKAESKLRDALDRRPDDAETWFRLGDVISRRGDDRTKEAVEAMARAVEIDPSLVLAHLYLFRLCRLAPVPDGDPIRVRGEEAWRAVLRIHGRAQIAAALGGDSRDDAGTSEFALQEKVSLAPSEPAPRLELARHLHAERRYDEAVEAYRRAIERGADDPAVHAHLAAALASRGDAAAAAQELEAAAKSAPGDVKVHRLRAWVLLVLGRDAEAIQAADAALAAKPDDVLAKKLRALATMHAGDVDAGLQQIAALGWL